MCSAALRLGVETVERNAPVHSVDPVPRWDPRFKKEGLAGSEFLDHPTLLAPLFSFSVEDRRPLVVNIFELSSETRFVRSEPAGEARRMSGDTLSDLMGQTNANPLVCTVISPSTCCREDSDGLDKGPVLTQTFRKGQVGGPGGPDN